MITKNGQRYCILLRGKHDCRSQDYWSKYAIGKWGNSIDPYWTTEFNYEKSMLEDVLYVKENIRYKGVI